MLHLNSVGWSAEHCTRSCRIAWSNHDRADSFTSTDEEDACRSERLGKAASVLRQKNTVCGPRRSRTMCLVFFPNVRGALTFTAESQDVVTSATVAIGVPELGVETSAEIDGQLFVVLSALTEGESFDIVMSAGGDHGFESSRKLHGRWNPYAAGRARSHLREILSPTQVKLLELKGAQDQYIGKIMCVAGSEIDREAPIKHSKMLASNSRRREVGLKDQSPGLHENRD